MLFGIARQPVLNNVSLNIKNGDKVAIVGQSGGGKTTLAKLILGLWTPECGNININGYNIEEIDKKTLRQKVAYVPQNVEMFSGTVEENLKLGKHHASYNEMKQVCIKAGCSEFIEKMPVKYSTYLEEAGTNLSGGERQRIALARALIKQPEILILDEATSNLDFVSEAKIYDTLFNIDATVIIIAHRLSTIRRCDNIIVIDNNQIAQQGTHAELLKDNGIYHKIWTSQVGEAEIAKTSKKGKFSQKLDIVKIKDEDIITYE